VSPVELPLPLPLAAAKAALVVAFLVHIVFVNLMVGGTLLALAAHALSRRDAFWLGFAGQLMGTVTVHKSLAVVLGVGPLLLVSVAYTEPFYASSLLLAPFWLSVLWLVTLAFGLLYAYKYGFGGWGERRPRWHAASGVAGAVVLLCVPLIYLTNTQLMLDATAMARRPTFFDAMLNVGNVLPRYLHFLLASVAIAGLWVMGWWGRAAAPTPPEERARLVAFGGRAAIVTTAAQFVVGPLVLFTLPRGALTWPAVSVLAVGVLAGLGAIFTLLDMLRGAGRLRVAVALIGVTLVCMGTTRHLIREALLQRPAEATALQQDAPPQP
jgi:cytochrome c